MKVKQPAPLVVPLLAAACLAGTATSALAKEVKVPTWKDQHAHGLVGCLAQEAASPHYFDLVNAKSDEGQPVVATTAIRLGTPWNSSFDGPVDPYSG